MDGKTLSGLGPSINTREMQRLGVKVTDALDAAGNVIANLVGRVDDLEKLVKPPGPNPPGPGPEPNPEEEVYLVGQREKFYGDILVARKAGDYERAVALLDELRAGKVDDPDFNAHISFCVQGATYLMANHIGESLRTSWEAISPDVPDAVERVTMRNMACASVRMGCMKEALGYVIEPGYATPEELANMGVTFLFN